MHLPGPLRAAVGLAATAADELKHLPDRAVELPMLAVSTALQMSLRAQQRYAQLARRGEQLLNREQPSEDPPPWATFDEPVSVEEMRRAALSQLDSLIEDGPDAAAPDAGDGRATGRMFEDLFGVSDPAANAPAAVENDSDSNSNSNSNNDATVTPITQASGASKTGAAPRKSARKTPRKTATRKTANKSAPVSEQSAPPAKKATRKTAARTDKSPAAEPSAEPAAESSAKPVNKPRHTAPSKFDDADDS